MKQNQHTNFFLNKFSLRMRPYLNIQMNSKLLFKEFRNMQILTPKKRKISLVKTEKHFSNKL